MPPISNSGPAEPGQDLGDGSLSSSIRSPRHLAPARPDRRAPLHGTGCGCKPEASRSACLGLTAAMGLGPDTAVSWQRTSTAVRWCSAPWRRFGSTGGHQRAPQQGARLLPMGRQRRTGTPRPYALLRAIQGGCYADAHRCTATPFRRLDERLREPAPVVGLRSAGGTPPLPSAPARACQARRAFAAGAL